MKVEAIVLLALLGLCLLFLFRKKKKTTIFTKNDLVDIFDKYGCRVRGHITHVMGPDAYYVRYHDSKGVFTHSLLNSEEIYEPGPYIKTEP